MLLTPDSGIRPTLANEHWDGSKPIFTQRRAQGRAILRLGAWGLGREVEGQLTSVALDAVELQLSEPLAVGESVEFEARTMSGHRVFRAPAVTRKCHPGVDGGQHIVLELERRQEFRVIARLFRWW